MPERRIKVGDCVVVAFCDPAARKQKVPARLQRITARSAIVVVAMDHLERIFPIFSWAQRTTTNYLIDKILETNDRYKPSVFGIEANAMQSLFADSVHRVAKLEKKRIPITPVYQSTKVDKIFRIKTVLQRVVNEDRQFICESEKHGELLKDEVKTFPMAQTVDLVDALAGAVALLPKVPVREDRDLEIEQLTRWLKASGATPHQIEQRILQTKDAFLMRRPEPSRRIA